MSPSICLSPLDRSETLRYLGMTEAAADNAFLSRLDACEAKLLRHATPRYTYCILPLTRTESVLYADTLLLEGNDIRQHLEGCDRAVLMAATLGTSVDVLIDRTQKRDMTNALLMDALANTAIEQVCDKAEQQIQETTETYLMNPRKSVSAIFGCAQHPLPKRRQGCSICKMRETCAFRKKGAHCGGTT